MHQIPKLSCFIVSFCSWLCPIHWSQVLSREWRCSWSSTSRRCSNHIWVINNFNAYWGVSYIRGFTVMRNSPHWKKKKKNNQKKIYAELTFNLYRQCYTCCSSNNIWIQGINRQHISLVRWKYFAPYTPWFNVCIRYAVDSLWMVVGGIIELILLPKQVIWWLHSLCKQVMDWIH